MKLWIGSSPGRNGQELRPIGQPVGRRAFRRSVTYGVPRRETTPLERMQESKPVPDLMHRGHALIVGRRVATRKRRIPDNDTIEERCAAIVPWEGGPPQQPAPGRVGIQIEVFRRPLMQRRLHLLFRCRSWAGTEPRVVDGTIDRNRHKSKRGIRTASCPTIGRVQDVDLRQESRITQIPFSIGGGDHMKIHIHRHRPGVSLEGCICLLGSKMGKPCGDRLSFLTSTGLVAHRLPLLMNAC